MEDLSQVDFAPGSAEISEPEREALEKLVAAMVDRPRLRLDIRGRAVPAIDGPALGSAAAAFGVDDWEEFARSRALAVQAEVLRNGRLSAENVFVVGVEVAEAAAPAAGSTGSVAVELELGAR